MTSRLFNRRAFLASSFAMLAPRLRAAGNVYYVLGTGQSLSLGLGGTPALSTDNPNTYGNYRLEYPTLPDVTGIVSLYEATQESPCTSMGNQAAAMGSRVYMVDHYGVGGKTYAELAKGTDPYANSIAGVSRASTLLTGLSKTMVAAAIDVIHGEQDWAGSTTGAQYQADLEEWQSDYSADLGATLPLFLCQMHSWTSYGTARTTPITSGGAPGVPIGQWQTAKAHYDDRTIILVGPKYHLAYSDQVHLTNAGYRLLGAQHGKVMDIVLRQGLKWRPLCPRSITRSGAVVSVRFWVPAAPLILDDVSVDDPGNYGFEWIQTGGSARTISLVEASGDTVTITLSGDPGTPTTEEIAYAYTGTYGNAPGPTSGPRGCLRDSDNTAAWWDGGTLLRNWAITFRESVGYSWEDAVTAPRVSGRISGRVGD